MTNQEFIRISEFVESKVGINLADKRSLITGRLDNYLSRNGYSDYTEYMNCVERDVTGKMVEELINTLTTNHTYFMREKEHFEFFREVVLPELKEAKGEEKDLRIWCGASSTGEEPYTLAMIIHDFFSLDGAGWDTQLLATDVATNVLKYAMKGIYTEEQIEPLPDTWKRRYFHKVGEGKVEISKEIKDQVLYRQFNLMSALPFRKPMQVIFLRNVLIYFETDVKNELLKRIYDCLEPGGYLFIGTTEAVDRNVIPFRYIQPSVYRK